MKTALASDDIKVTFNEQNAHFLQMRRESIANSAYKVPLRTYIES